MASKSHVTYKYGITGFVELHKNIVKKYSEFDQLYWLKEYAVLLYLWTYRTDNIIKYQSGSILHKTDPLSGINKKYNEMILKRYPSTLHERRLYRDNEIIQFLLDMTSAMKFLNSKNISHRDIKPSNIAISDSGRFILIDFSHAHKMEFPLGKLDAQVVTYYYRSPEVFTYQITGENQYDASIDMWALGMVLMEILTGTPFAAYYTEAIKDHDKSERLYGMFLQDAKKSFGTIKEVYFAKKRGFVYGNKYWGWLSKMLAHEPERRITFEELYNLVIEFALSHKIQSIEPVNGVVEVKMPTLEAVNNLQTDDQKRLYVECIQHLKDIRKQHKMLFDVNRINRVVQYLICQGDITNDNYQYMLAGLAIIVETVLFDGVTDFDNYGDLDNSMVKDAIVLIMQKYDQHLFGANRIFTYDTPTDELTKVMGFLKR